MKNGLSCLLFLLWSAASAQKSVISKKYSYISVHLSWQDARDFCTSHYTDLATIYEQSDADDLKINSFSAWIGLYRSKETQDEWVWSNGRQYPFSGWAVNASYQGQCASVFNLNKKVYGEDCEDHLFFICHGSGLLVYHLVPESRTWNEAQQFCREQHANLATFSTGGVLEAAVGGDLDTLDFPVWTGLHRDGGGWRWSGGLSDYRRWRGEEPGAGGGCASISSAGKEMEARDCGARFPFVCMAENVVLVRENRSWEGALEHCRGLGQDLLSLQPGQEHRYVMTKVAQAHSQEVWTGLRFLAGEWLWVGGADLLYTGLPACPPPGQHCGVLLKEDSGGLEPRDCSERKNFLCYKR